MKRLLFVDDNDIVTRLFVRMLSKKYVVTGAKNAEAALACLEEASYDVVVTDLRLGSFDGVDLRRVIARQYPDVRVILISGLDVKADTTDQFDGFLRKPIECDRLIEAVEQSLAMKH
jgi:DNA-binding NtrC family response regulator